ncbi:gluconate 2-dehydrogenase subunit 3 family protein [Pedobacter sp. MW01-1-1]|uniref:gluconate 2-dehydrogenase subunit 3 family protein n=1 Tax=Pedobacter sp. MW01-1-1 TaxID=3383027 RepID=UPI003FEE822A
MQRREALKNVAILLGGAISASTVGVLFESFTIPETEKNTASFSIQDEQLLAEFAEVIVPTTTSSKGAKAAGLGPFIPMMIRDCYPAKMQESFALGLKAFDAKVKKEYTKSFIALTPAQRIKVMGDIRTLAIAQKASKSEEDKDLANFFIIARDLSLLGYYSSEIGCTQARRYLPIPGKYDGAYPLKPGQKSWAT